MARVPLPKVDQVECCPTCNRPYGVTGFVSFMPNWGYATGLIGEYVDPEAIKGPSIDEDTP